jgi:exopolyphosphatase/guanosine-5'-triphosphate,3'-diphosphate pyrophosphatase
MRFASVDIGSNAVRLLFCEVYPFQNSHIIKKTSLVRLPIRLGEDVFLTKTVSEKNIEKLIKSLEAFKKLVDVYDVITYRVCATSAMREAENGADVIDVVKKYTGIDIEIIDGEIEAELIFETHVAEKIDTKGTFLYMDVGGGSTELTLFSNGEKIISKSFRIGTIRLKNDLVTSLTWEELINWVIKVRKKYQPSMIIATGGNINKIYKLCGLENYKLLEYSTLKQMYKFLNKHSVEERIVQLGLKPDRADVITHASNLYLKVMKAAKVKDIFVPKVGLADGIIEQLYAKHNAKN